MELGVGDGRAVGGGDGAAVEGGEPVVRVATRGNPGVGTGVTVEGESLLQPMAVRQDNRAMVSAIALKVSDGAQKGRTLALLGDDLVLGPGFILLYLLVLRQ